MDLNLNANIRTTKRDLLVRIILNSCIKIYQINHGHYLGNDCTLWFHELLKNIEINFSLDKLIYRLKKRLTTFYPYNIKYL